MSTATAATVRVPDVPLSVFFANLESKNLRLELNPETQKISLYGPEEKRTPKIRAYIQENRDKIVAALQKKQGVGTAPIPTEPIADPLAELATSDIDAEERFREPVQRHSPILGDTIRVAGDNCPCEAILEGEIVYRPAEISSLHGMTQGQQRAYHANKRALLPAWLRYAGYGWMYENEFKVRVPGPEGRYYYVVVRESEVNAQTIARAADLTWGVANSLINQLCMVGVMRSWATGQQPQLCIVSPAMRKRSQEKADTVFDFSSPTRSDPLPEYPVAPIVEVHTVGDDTDFANPFGD